MGRAEETRRTSIGPYRLLRCPFGCLSPEFWETTDADDSFVAAFRPTLSQRWSDSGPGDSPQKRIRLPKLATSGAY